MFDKFIEKILKTETEQLPRIFKDAFYIVIISIFLGLAINIFNPNGFDFVSKNRERNQNIVMISSEEARIKKYSGAALFIDSRQPDEYEILRINDSINIQAIPETIAEKKIKNNSGLISKPLELVLYCDGTACGSSELLAKKLIEMGYKRHIYIIKNGIAEWHEKGYPVEGVEQKGNNL